LQGSKSTKINSGRRFALTRLGSLQLQRSPDPLADEEGLAIPTPKNSTTPRPFGPLFSAPPILNTDRHLCGQVR